MFKWVLESERLKLREICWDDMDNIAPILKDAEIMYAWEHGFTDVEVSEWIEKNIQRYRNDGHSFYLAVEKNSNVVIGMIGLIIENIENNDYLGIAYILDKRFWNRGYGYEGAAACLNYAFAVLGASKVIAQIRPSNCKSRNIAEKLGMYVECEYVKRYKNQDMPHLVYAKYKDS